MHTIFAVFFIPVFALVNGACKDVEVVTRNDWGARPPRERVEIATPVNMTFVHHTAGTWQCNDKETCIQMVRSVQDFHMDDRGWDDVGYSFLVGEDGRVYEGRGWGIQGAHTKGYNSVAHALCVIGDYTSRLPDKKALDAVRNMIQCGIDQGYITAVYELFGHRDAGCTACPGDMLYAEIKTWPEFSDRVLEKPC